jgi:hypothetical protein
MGGKASRVASADVSTSETTCRRMTLLDPPGEGTPRRPAACSSAALRSRPVPRFAAPGVHRSSPIGSHGPLEVPGLASERSAARRISLTRHRCFGAFAGAAPRRRVHDDPDRIRVSVLRIQRVGGRCPAPPGESSSETAARNTADAGLPDRDGGRVADIRFRYRRFRATERGAGVRRERPASGDGRRAARRMLLSSWRSQPPLR